MKQRVLSYLSVAVVMVIAACSQGTGDSPFSPSGLDTSPAATAGTPAVQPEQPIEQQPTEPDDSQDSDGPKAACSARFTAKPLNFADNQTVGSGSTLQVQYWKTGDTDPDQLLHLAVFQMFQDGPQQLVGEPDIKSMGDRGVRTYRVTLPSGCLNLQIDAGCGETIPENAKYNGFSDFNNAWFVNTDACGITPTPTPPPNPTPTPTPTPDPTCEDYEAPAITGDISSDLGDTSVTFDTGTVAPSGGSFSPALPLTVDLLNPGHEPGSFSTTYTLSYGPEELECSTSKTFTKPVPPREPDCEEANPPDHGSISINGPFEQQCEEGEPYEWVYKVTGGGPSTRESRCEDDFNLYNPDGSYQTSVAIPGEGVVDACVFTTYPGSDDFQRGLFGAPSRFRLVQVNREEECHQVRKNPITCSVSVENAGDWNLVLKATNPGNHTKRQDPETLQCGGQATLNVSYNWKGHDSQDWQCLLFLNGSQVDQSAVVDGNP